jgi:hypothetical protein
MEKILVSPYLIKGMLYLITLFGSTAMYVFSLSKGFHGSVDFLRKMFPDHSQLFYDRIDFFVVIFAGSVIGTIFFSPTNTLQALAAGFGWVGAINVLMSRKK